VLPSIDILPPGDGGGQVRFLHRWVEGTIRNFKVRNVLINGVLSEPIIPYLVGMLDINLELRVQPNISSELVAITEEFCQLVFISFLWCLWETRSMVTVWICPTDCTHASTVSYQSNARNYRASDQTIMQSRQWTAIQVSPLGDVAVMGTLIQTSEPISFAASSTCSHGVMAPHSPVHHVGD
jgi:hypothetical protein